MNKATSQILSLAHMTAAPAPPDQAHLSITDRCMMSCIHCDIHEKTTKDLPTEHWIDFITKLASWTIKGVNFSGGEPLLRKDLEQLIAHCIDTGLEATFNTHGWLLNKDRCRSIATSKVTTVYVSLDGARPETVDKSRAKKGAFDHAVTGIKQLRELGTNVIISTILHGKNAKELPELLDLAKKLDVQLVVQPLYQNFGDSPWNPRWFERSELWPTPEELVDVIKAIDLLYKIRSEWGPVCNSRAQLEAIKAYFKKPLSHNGLTCRAGHTDLSVDASGDVRLCFFQEPIGNITTGKSPQAMWLNPRTMRRRWEVTKCTRSCNLLNCNFETDGGM